MLGVGAVTGHAGGARVGNPIFACDVVLVDEQNFKFVNFVNKKVGINAYHAYTIAY
jgi:hypothetical protein